MNEGTHQASWLRIVVVYIRKTQFSRDEAHFSVSYEMNDRKKLFQRVFENIMIRFFCVFFSCRPYAFINICMAN